MSGGFSCKRLVEEVVWQVNTNDTRKGGRAEADTGREVSLQSVCGLERLVLTAYFRLPNALPGTGTVAHQVPECNAHPGVWG